MLGKYFIILFLFLSLLVGNCFANNLGRLPTIEQIQKFCVGVQLKVDNQIHYFSFFSIKSFDEEGLRVAFGKNRDKENFIPKVDILNFQEAMDEYLKLKGELGGVR